MKSRIEIMFFVAASVLMLLLVFVLPLFSFPGYSIICNNISELGAQFSPNGWIINFTIVLLAASSVIAGWQYFEGFILHRIILVLFGISLALTAVFNHAPVNTGIRYNITEAGLHSYFAATAVLSFTILALAAGLTMERQKDRLLAVATGLSLLALSVMASQSDHLSGIWQRLMFLISFGWMIYILNSNTNQ